MNSITFFMKAFCLSILLSVSFFCFGQKHTTSIGFIENKGQIVDQKGKENTTVKYLLNTNGLNVQLRQNGFSYDVYESKNIPLIKNDRSFDNFDKKDKEPKFSTKLKFHRIDIDFLNSNKNTILLAEEKSLDYDNYYNVLYAPEGITNVHKYQKVTYKNIYDNIDIVFFIPKDSTKVVEYNFIVKPGGKVSDIQLKFNGAKTDLIENKIQINLRFGKMEETLPLSWVEHKNQKQEININYKKIKKGVYGFEGDFNNSNKTIVIDPVPVRLWGTFYGGTYQENNFNSTIKYKGDFVYLGGFTNSANNISSQGSYQSSISSFSNDAFITKFSDTGNRIWGTYYGGSHNDAFLDFEITNNDYIYCVGQTGSSTNIVTTNAYQVNYNGWYDGMLIKFDNNGFRIWGTYFGGQDIEDMNNIKIDSNQNLYVVGSTNSIQNISTPNSFKPNIDLTTNSQNQQFDAFLAKFDLNGNIIWSTYYGGNSHDSFESVDVDSNGNIFCSGTTDSYDQISTPNAYQINKTMNPNGTTWNETFIVKFNSIGERIWGTYYGGEDYDFNDCIKIDKFDNLIISGNTRSWTGIGNSNSFQPVNGGGGSGIDSWDSYLAKFNNNGNLMWSTYYGGENIDGQEDNNVDIDENNNIYFISSGASNNNIVTQDAYDSLISFNKIFIIKFNENGQRIWGTYFGNNTTYSGSIAYASNGEFYITGYTYGNTDISTPNSFQSTFGGVTDSFIVKFLDCQSVAIANSNSPTCIGSNLELNASGGTNYNWTGPNGFTSTDQNPIIPNASMANSGQYLCEITGTSGCDNTITLNIVIGDTIAPVPNITSLSQINGDCNTIITSIPTALDNCAGAINATTTDPLAYSVPGNYTITWNFDDGNGNSSSQTQNVTITSVNPPAVTSPQIFCFQDNATINEIVITGQNITWYDAQTGGNILASTTALQNGITYYATQTINNCESNRAPILVTIQNTPVPTGSATQTFCSTQNASLNDISINGTNIIWYTDNTSTTALSNSTVLLDNTSYFATQTINGCESPTRFEVHIDLINTLNALDYQEMLCDDLDDGSELLNLTTFNSNLIATTGNTFSYYTSLNGAENQNSSDQITNISNYNLNIGITTIFVRIDSQNGCHQVVELKLTLVSKPRIATSDIMPICEATSITINAGNGFDNYNWSTGATTQSIIVSQAGNYSVTVTENHNGISCSSTKNFTVVNSNAATVSEIITSDWTDNNNTITVLLTNSSVGNYVYSLDGINYQSSNVFSGLESGEYTVFVKDTNGCGISNEEIYLLMYPKYFTPNGDSYNDTWKIKFSQKEPNLKVAIFDRYGKLLKIMNSYEAWDGKFNGKDMPSDDYWFVVTRQNGKEFRGHFAMKR